jgi:hypothetical protein
MIDSINIASQSIWQMTTLRSFPHSWLITGFVTRLTRRVPLVEQELPTLPVYLSTPVFSGVPVTRCLVLCVCVVDSCLSFCTFSFGHCVVCSSAIYGFWWPLCYLQTLLVKKLCMQDMSCMNDFYCAFVNIVVHEINQFWDNSSHI